MECDVSQDDYAVFTAVLDGLPKNYPEQAKALKGKELVVSAQTEPPTLSVDNWKYYDFGSTPPSQETEASFRARAERSCRLSGSLRTEESSRLITAEEISRLFKSEGGWKAFRQKFPNSTGSLLTFSLPGYDSKHTEAIVVMSYSCGDGCGGETLVLLKKDNGKWTVAKHLVDLMG